MQIHPNEKIKGKVTRLWIAALALMPTVVDLSPSSASYAVVTVERQHTLCNETLLGWRASPEKNEDERKMKWQSNSNYDWTLLQYVLSAGEISQLIDWFLLQFHKSCSLLSGGASAAAENIALKARVTPSWVQMNYRHHNNLWNNAGVCERQQFNVSLC